MNSKHVNFIAVATVCFSLPASVLYYALTVNKTTHQPLDELKIRAALGTIPNDPDSWSIVVFYDYQCPYCHSMIQNIERAQASGQLYARLILRHFPLTGHPVASQSAILAKMCKNNRVFSECHSDLLKLGTKFNLDDIKSIQEKHLSELDPVEVARVNTRINSDIADGHTLGIEGVPAAYAIKGSYGFKFHDVANIISITN